MKFLRFRQALSALLVLALSALLWFLLMSTGGVALVVAGVYLLVGLGWSFVAAGFSYCSALR